MKKLFVSILLGGILLSTTYAQLQDRFSFSTNQLRIDTINNFVKVSMEGCTQTRIVGSPELPYMEVRYVIPFNKRIASINITDSLSQNIASSYLVYPAQPDYFLNEPVPAFVEPDSIIYGSDESFPNSLVALAAQYYDKGYHIAVLHIYSLTYYPLSQLLKLYTSIAFTLNYEDETHSPVVPSMPSPNMQKSLKNFIASQVRNAEDLDIPIVIDPDTTEEPPLYDLPPSMYYNYDNHIRPEYIIITNNTDLTGNSVPKHQGKTMTEIFQELADWKTKKGVPTIVVTLDEIKSLTWGRDLQHQIHNFLKEVYKTYGSIYVLFGGDISIIPARLIIYKYKTPIPTDLYYTAIMDVKNTTTDIRTYGEMVDNTSQFFYGRALASNGKEANTFVSKVISYEKLSNVPNKNYVNNLLFAVADMGYYENYAPPFDYLTATIAEITQYGVNKWKLFDPKPYFSPIYDGDEVLSRQNMLNSLNVGQSFGKFHLVYHLDHSGWDGMGTSSEVLGEGIKNSDMDELTNAQVNPYWQILYTNGCNPGEFTKDCIIKHYINNSNGGGVAAIASSNISGGEQENLNFCTFVRELYKIPTSYGNYNIGKAHDISISHNDVLNKRKNHLFGDPEMPVWTNTPHTLTVTGIPLAISNITSTLSITVSNMIYEDEVIVCLMKGDDIYKVLQGGGGSATTHTFTFTDIYPQTAGTLHITVTGHNYLPYERSVPVYIGGENIYISSHSVIDAASIKNNQQLDAGETANISIALENNWFMPISGVIAELSCVSLNPNIDINDILTISNPIVSYGTLEANSSKTLADFEVIIENDVLDNTWLNFILTITANSGYSIIRSFAYQIHAPELEFIQNIYTINGNDYYLSIEVQNTGSSFASNVTGTLSTLEPSTIIDINQSVAQYGTIDCKEVKRNVTAFQFELLSSFVGKSLKLTLEDNYGKQWEKDIYLSFPIHTVRDLKSAGTPNSITLTWAPPQDNSYIGYNVYRSSTVNGTYQRLNSFLLYPESIYIDEGLLYNTVFYYQVSYINSHGNESPKSFIIASTTLPYLLGYPITIPDRLGSFAGSPMAMDIKKNGYKALFFGTYSEANCGTLYAFDHTGKELYDIDNDPNTINGFVHLKGEINGTPALADVNNDDEIEVVFATRRDWPSNLSDGGKVFAYKTTGDINGDGKPDLCWSASVGENMHGVILAPLKSAATIESFVPLVPYNTLFPLIAHNGVQYDNIPYTMGQQGWDYYNTAAIADIDNDGHQEIVYNTRQGIFVYQKNSLGKYALSWSTTTGFLPQGYNYTDIPAVLVDLNGNGKMEIVFLIRNTNSFICCALRHDGTAFISGWDANTSRSISSSAIFSRFAVGDLNNDGNPEIVMTANNNMYVFNHQGNLLTSFAVFAGLNMNNKSPLLADVDRNNDVEIIAVGNDNKIYAYKLNGSLVSGFPLESGGEVTPCITDMDYDGKSEIIGIGNGKVYVWKTEGDARKIEWGHIRFNERNTGAYLTPCTTTHFSSQTVNTNTIVTGCDIYVKNVNVTNNTKLILDAENETTIDGEFEIQLGSELEIK